MWQNISGPIISTILRENSTATDLAFRIFSTNWEKAISSLIEFIHQENAIPGMDLAEKRPITDDATIKIIKQPGRIDNESYSKFGPQ